MKKILAVLFVMLMVQACNKEIDKGLRSPCVSSNASQEYRGEEIYSVSSPCDVRKPINNISKVEI